MIMKKKTTIKVIKRDERSRQQKPTEDVAQERKSAQEAARASSGGLLPAEG